MLELYSNLVSIYNKSHALHIRTVNMKGCPTLHSTIGNHYETLQGMVDRVGEDIIVKSLGKTLPTTSECLKKATINEEMELENAEDIVDELYKDYEYLSSDLKKKATSEKNLLVQNILIELWDLSTKFCADMEREMECD